MYVRDAIDVMVEAGEPVAVINYKGVLYELQEHLLYEDCKIYVYKDNKGNIIHLGYTYLLEKEFVTKLKTNNIDDVILLYNKLKSDIYNSFFVVEVFNNNKRFRIQEIANRHLNKLRDMED